MGFYGNTHELSLNDYFQSFKLKKAYHDSGEHFPQPTQVLGSTSDTAVLTAVVPAQDATIATGNKWIQFVVDNDNAGMNNTESVACGVTIFHKKADGTVTGEMIDFSNAVLNNVNAGTAENPIGVLGYGKTFSINPVSFDEAGHAKGTSASGIVSYALPKVISSKDDYDTAVAK